MMLKLTISDGKTVYTPAVEEGITLELERRATPGRLSFTVAEDKALKLAEGNAVQLWVDGVGVFAGFVFIIKRDRDGMAEVTAYDQLRYLKNKDTYAYTAKKASELVRMIAEDYQLQTGLIEDSGWVIPFRLEDNQTLADILLNALHLTVQNTGRSFMLFDHFGKLTLREDVNMALNLLLDAETIENYDMTGSIDSDTYNQIKLVRENQKAGKREVFDARDAQTIGRWGILQHFDKLEEQENGQAKAQALLRRYNAPRRSLSVSGAFGDTRVRPGSIITVRLAVKGVSGDGRMMVEKVRHQFEEGIHTMDLDLKGGAFSV